MSLSNKKWSDELLCNKRSLADRNLSYNMELLSEEENYYKERFGGEKRKVGYHAWAGYSVGHMHLFLSTSSVPGTNGLRGSGRIPFKEATFQRTPRV